MSGTQQRLAEALARHTATVMSAPGRLAWLDCSCGWETVIATRAGEAQEQWRLHVAQAALLPVVEAIAAERAAEELRAAVTAVRSVGEEHVCDWCSVDVRNLAAVAHNAAWAVDAALQGGGDWSRARRKLAELHRTLDDVQPLLDAHFAAALTADGKGQ